MNEGRKIGARLSQNHPPVARARLTQLSSEGQHGTQCDYPQAPKAITMSLIALRLLACIRLSPVLTTTSLRNAPHATVRALSPLRA
jgi:hypothetical protein